VSLVARMPWFDRTGRVSRLKAAVFALTLVPALWIGYQAATGMLIPRPWTEATHQTGVWALRFLLIALAVTPARHIFDRSKIMQVRRMLGLTALTYALAHLAMYMFDQNLDLPKITSEIIMRLYLTIGFIAVVAMVVLGVTSTDGMIRRLGAVRWRRLHLLVHPITILGILHFFMQSKLDASEAALMSGLYVLLLLYRLMIKRRIQLTLFPLAGAAILGALATAGLEASWYGLATRVKAHLILEANLDFDAAIRPAWWVLAAGLALAFASLARRRSKARGPSRPNAVAPA
jgi:sulfoxide reductase heme-binding subunit YedZ